MDKVEIRRAIKSRELEFFSVSPSLAEEETAAIWSEVENRPEFVRAKNILIYMDIYGEVPTVDFIRKHSGDKRFVFPLVKGECLELHACGLEELIMGYKGIREPSPNTKIILPSEVDLALIPGVAFAVSAGKVLRMGRGKGFYDRLIPSLNCPLWGISFSFRILSEIPVDTWDRPLDDIICGREK